MVAAPAELDVGVGPSVVVVPGADVDVVAGTDDSTGAGWGALVVVVAGRVGAGGDVALTVVEVGRVT